MIAIVLAGGRGTRFWPLSRSAQPKQLLNLIGERSLLQQTVHRLSPLVSRDRVYVCTTEALGDASRTQLPDLESSRWILEPAARDTAAAIGWSVASLPEAHRDDIVVVLSSDHWIEDEAAFRDGLAVAAQQAQSGDAVVTIGIPPAWAETGYGYVEVADPIESGVPQQVVDFREKPDQATAVRFFRSGRHLWNAGIFLFRGGLLLDAFERFQPELAEGFRALTAASSDEERRAIYEGLPRTSIDYGVMEKLEKIHTVPVECGWNDLGSWGTLPAVLESTVEQNSLVGDVVELDCHDNLLFADRGTIAALGVSGLVVVRTGDTTLVTTRDRAQDVKRLVDELGARGRDDLL